MAILNATATLNGRGSVTAAALLRAAGRATLSGSGQIAVTSVRHVVANLATLAGRGGVVARGSLRLPASATIQGVGSLTAFPSLTDFPDPVYIPPVTVREPIDDYLDLVPAYNAVRPKFIATLRAVLQPLVDQKAFLESMPQQFDLDRAVGVQLDQVGIWIGRSRFINTPITGVFFSWDIPGLGWEQGTWQGTFDPSEGITSLDDETYRQLLYAKVAANEWDSSIDGIVKILGELFGTHGVTVQVLDNQDMTMTVNVIGVITSLVFRSLLTGGYIPIKPVGVNIQYLLDAVEHGQFATATLAGRGNLTATAVLRVAGRATLAGVGTIARVGGVPGAGTATLAGVGSISASGVVRARGAATLAGVGNLTATATLRVRNAATLAGVGRLIVDPIVIAAGTPAAAAAVGYNTRTFGPGLTYGTNWKDNNFLGNGTFDHVDHGDGTITVTYASLATAHAEATTPYWSGKAFGGGCYIEATFALTGAPDGAFPFLGVTMRDVETWAKQTAGVVIPNWPSQAAGYGDWVDGSVVEFFGGASYTVSINNFWGPWDTAENVGDYDISGQPISPAGSPDFTAQHRYGLLWVPATAGTPGYVKRFFDGVQVGNTVTWNQYNSALGPPPVAGSTAWSILDTKKIMFFLSGKSTNAVLFTKFEVWQASDANNETH